MQNQYVARQVQFARLAKVLRQIELSKIARERELNLRRYWESKNRRQFERFWPTV